MTGIPDNELAFCRQWVSTHRWQTAKSMPTIPHEYSIRNWGKGEEFDRDFMRFMLNVHAYGVVKNFNRRRFVYLFLDDKKYWLDSWVSNVWTDHRAIVNRSAHVSYGNQTISDPNPALPIDPFDRVAPRYDEMYGLENREGYREIAKHVRRESMLLDIGCRTGDSLRRFGLLSASRYVGIDPSNGMRNAFMMRHEHALFVHQRFEDWVPSATFDIAVAMHGSASRIDPRCYLKMRDAAPRYHYVFYAPAIQPLYWGQSMPMENRTDLARIRETFPNVVVNDRYVIATNLKDNGS